MTVCPGGGRETAPVDGLCLEEAGTQGTLQLAGRENRDIWEGGPGLKLYFVVSVLYWLYAGKLFYAQFSSVILSPHNFGS